MENRYGAFESIPEFKELLKLRNVDPMVHEALTMVDSGQCSLEEAMVALVLELIRMKEKRIADDIARLGESLAAGDPEVCSSVGWGSPPPGSPHRTWGFVVGPAEDWKPPTPTNAEGVLAMVNPSFCRAAAKVLNEDSWPKSVEIAGEALTMPLTPPTGPAAPPTQMKILGYPDEPKDNSHEQ